MFKIFFLYLAKIALLSSAELAGMPQLPCLLPRLLATESLTECHEQSTAQHQYSVHSL